MAGQAKTEQKDGPPVETASDWVLWSWGGRNEKSKSDTEKVKGGKRRSDETSAMRGEGAPWGVNQNSLLGTGSLGGLKKSMFDLVWVLSKKGTNGMSNYIRDTSRKGGRTLPSEKGTCGLRKEVCTLGVSTGCTNLKGVTVRVGGRGEKH